MQAKILISGVTVNRREDDQSISSVQISAFPVSEAPFDGDGKSDDNDFARWTPSGKVELTITNPALFERFKAGQKFYVNFVEAKSESDNTQPPAA